MELDLTGIHKLAAEKAAQAAAEAAAPEAE